MPKWMPKSKEAEYRDATIQDAYFKLEIGLFECKVEDENKEHSWPSLFLQNKGGGKNQKAFDELKAIFGWDGMDGDELLRLAKEKGKIRVSAKLKDDGVNAWYNFVKPKEGKEKKPAPASADVNSWLASLNGGSPADLSIPDSSVPF